MAERRQSLAAGDRVGPYQVLSALGEGGMGEVYRAHDTVLGRQVAVKVLAERFGADPDRLARLDREARVLASLNHPNIATIYGLEPSAGWPALILELVEGPTLDNRLAAGAMSLRDALGVARQIASALEAAHEHGVIHRDLKPANVKIRPDGTVKVLDFGIARVIDDAGGDGGVEEARTITATSPGTVLGTPSYMSPEQARGTEVTRRSDVWAFGAVLYEMLTGQRAFRGATRTDVLAAILHTTPDWTALPPSTPPAIARLVRRCLERDPRSRVHDIGDARLEIEDVERSLDGAAPVVALPGASGARSRGARRAAIALAAVVLLGAVATVAYLISTRRTLDIPPEIRLQMPPPSGTHFVSVPALSPDGRQIAFVAASDDGRAKLYLRPLSATAASEIPGGGGATYPFWSADSQSVAFFADGKIKRVAVSGGNPITICDAAVGRGGLWLDDDTIVFAPGSFSPLMRVNAAGGTPVQLTTLAADETGHRFPQRLPGRQLLYFSVNRAPEKSGARLISIDDPARAIGFFPSRGAVEYVNGHVLYMPTPGGNLVAHPVDLATGRLSGQPTEIGQARISETFARYVMSTAPAGVIATLGAAVGVGQFTWMSRDGRMLETIGEPFVQLGVELSPDGQQLATFRSEGIWTMNLSRPVPNRVTPSSYRHPIWSPDGTKILSLFQGRGIGTFDLVVTSLTTGRTESLRESTAGLFKPMSWTRDGRTIIFIQPEKSRSPVIWKMPADDPGKAAVYLENAQIFEARLSPDGQWMAYATDRSGRFEIEVRSFPTPGPAYPVSTEGGGFPRWRADGRELYYVSANARLAAASFTPGAPPSIGRPEPLFEVRLVSHPDRGNFAAYEYDVVPDGSRFLVNRLVSPPETSLTIIANWRPPS